MARAASLLRPNLRLWACASLVPQHVDSRGSVHLCCARRLCPILGTRTPVPQTNTPQIYVSAMMHCDVGRIVTPNEKIILFWVCPGSFFFTLPHIHFHNFRSRIISCFTNYDIVYVKRCAIIWVLQFIEHPYPKKGYNKVLMCRTPPFLIKFSNAEQQIQRYAMSDVHVIIMNFIVFH